MGRLIPFSQQSTSITYYSLSSLLISNFLKNIILRDVAKRNKVAFNKHNTDEQIEQYLLQKLFVESINNASDEGLKKMLIELGYPTTNFTRQAATATLMVAWEAGG